MWIQTGALHLHQAQRLCCTVDSGPKGYYNEHGPAYTVRHWPDTKALPDTGEKRLLPKVLDAASRFELRPSDAKVAADMAELAIQPIFA